MAEFKIVISDPKTGKSYQKEAKDDAAKQFMGLKIGDKVKDVLDLAGYEFEITGGSDYCGFPMRKDVLGTMRKKILSTKGVGLNIKEAGTKKRKTVAGNTIFDRTAQINLRITKQGKTPLEAPAEEPEEKEEKPAEKPSEDKKEEKAEKQEKPKEDKPKDKKEENKNKPEDKKEDKKEEK